MKTALVIEDTADNMELITFILQANGFGAERAWTGQEGLDKVAATSPDFIILDIQLPDMKGTEVLERLQEMEETRAIPVIAMTSNVMAGDREKLMAAGCVGYIAKPIDPYLVMSQINEIIGE